MTVHATKAPMRYVQEGVAAASTTFEPICRATTTKPAIVPIAMATASRVRGLGTESQRLKAAVRSAIGRNGACLDPQISCSDAERCSLRVTLLFPGRRVLYLMLRFRLPRGRAFASARPARGTSGRG